MKCKKCGEKYKGKSCPSCGTKNNKFIVILIICVVLGIGIFGGVLANIQLNNDIKAANNYIANGEFEKAKEVLDNQFKTNNAQYGIYICYADYYLAQEDYIGAIDILEQGIKRCSSEDKLKEKLDLINSEYADEIIALEKAKQEAEQKEAEEAAKKEQERLEEEAKQEQKSKEDYIASCKEIKYEDLARNPDKYKSQSFKFTGKVIQVVEPTVGHTVVLRINVTKTEYDFYTDTIYATVSIPKESDRIFEGDIITIYGNCEGMYSYKSVLGQKISLPEIRIKYYKAG